VTVPTQSTPQAARAFIDRQHACLTRGEEYSFAIADLTSGEALGQIGLWLHDLPQGRASTGYWVTAHHHRHEIVLHASHVISTWDLGLPSIYHLELSVEPNEGSWRAAERVGYQREGLLRG
jgi:ribosomal-protein-alanine N-acetyltransferase